MDMVSIADFPLWACLEPVQILAPWLIGIGVFCMTLNLFKGVFN